MFHRWGWLGCTLSAGLLLQIAVQIRWLQWLPDFPIYVALALLAGLAALFSAAPALIKQRWHVVACGIVFVLLAVMHGGSAANADSSEVERWRDILLWPALAAGLATCLVTGKHWSVSLLLIWTLGEAAAAILACWYAPSSGEPPTVRANRYVLITGLVSLLACMGVLRLGQRTTDGWQFVILLLVSLLILSAASFVQTIPSDAQGLLMGIAALRFVLLVYLANRWLKSDATKTGEEQSSPATV